MDDGCSMPYSKLFYSKSLSPCSRRKLVETMIFTPRKWSLLIPMWNGLPRRACPAAWWDLRHGVSHSLIVLSIFCHCLLMDDRCSMPYSKLLYSYSFVTMQQKEVGVNDDLHPMKVIVADTLEWSAKEDVPSGMVRSTSWCISLSHYGDDWLSPTHGCTLKSNLNYFVIIPMSPCSRRKLV